MEKTIHLEYSLFDDGYKLYIVENYKGKRMVGELVFKELQNGDYAAPTYVMSDTQAKTLAAQLSRLGFVQSDDAGELAATKRHLQDMRYLAKVTKEPTE